MRYICFLSAAAVLLASSSGAAQMLPRPALAAHNWLGVTVGMGTGHAGEGNNMSGAFALVADVGVRTSERFAFVATGFVVADPSFGDKGLCAVTGTPPNQTVHCENTRNVAVNGGAISLAATLIEASHTPRFIVSAGGGAFRPEGGRAELGWVAGTQLVPLAFEHAAMIVAANLIEIPNDRGWRFWVAPITVGVRVY